MKKISGYTLVEISITLLISTIVVATAYHAFRIINSQFRVVQKENNEISQIQNLALLITKDCQRPGLIQLKNDKVFLYQENKDTTVYVIDNEHVIRFSSSRSDTFYTRLRIVEGLTSYLDINQGYCTRITLQTSDNISLLFFKEYSSAEINNAVGLDLME